MTERFHHPEFPRLVLFRHERSRFYQSQTYLDGKLVQKSLKTPDAPLALKLAKDWYKRLLRASVAFGRQHPIARLTTDPVIGELFIAYKNSLHGEHVERRRAEALKRWGPIQHFWKTLLLSEVTSETFDRFYRWRKVKPHTLHKDICVIRQVLRYAQTKTDLDFVIPPIPAHDRIETNPRPWLSKAEWEHLRSVAEIRIADAVSDGNTRLALQRQDCYDFACFMVASMCRVDELRALCFHHCEVETIDKRKILRCQFKGKTGMRVAYASPEAVTIYLARLKRSETTTALIFPTHHRDAFRELLKAANLYTDAFGNRRNYKALRATSISLAILRPNPPTLFQIARNAGTSVAIIDAHYSKRLTAEAGKDILTTTEPLKSLWRR